MGCCLLVILIIQATAFKQNVKNRGSDPPVKCGGELGLLEGCGGNA